MISLLCSLLICCLSLRFDGSNGMVILKNDNGFKNAKASLINNIKTAAPIIGVFSHHLNDDISSFKLPNDPFYIGASYVKYLESAGARVVPMNYDETNTTTLDHLFESLNGLLLPGGSAKIPFAFNYLYKKAKVANEQGDHFPIWGTCLGFEWIIEEEGESLDHHFDSENISLPLKFYPNQGVVKEESQLFKNAFVWDNIMSVAETAVAMNNHVNGITPEHFESSSFLRDFRVLATSIDKKGREFVAIMESKSQPIFGVQFHPEKSTFEFGKVGERFYEAINHNYEAVYFSTYLAHFFVNECRKNSHRFASAEVESKSLIYNTPIFHNDKLHSFIEIYLPKF